MTVEDRFEHGGHRFVGSEAWRMTEVVARSSVCEVAGRTEVRDHIGGDQLRTCRQDFAKHRLDAGGRELVCKRPGTVDDRGFLGQTEWLVAGLLAERVVRMDGARSRVERDDDLPVRFFER